MFICFKYYNYIEMKIWYFLIWQCVVYLTNSTSPKVDILTGNLKSLYRYAAVDTFNFSNHMSNSSLIKVYSLVKIIAQCSVDIFQFNIIFKIFFARAKLTTVSYPANIE